MSSDDYARGLHGKLLAECEQRNAALRAENERLQLCLGARNTESDLIWLEEVDRLRAALQALYDATKDATGPCTCYQWDAAELDTHAGTCAIWEFRSAAKNAGVVLSGDNPATQLTGENLGDSGMGQPGGVSDGPQ